MPPRLSIVVLPFTNLSDDHEQQYFADGIAEDLTTDLSRVGQMFVISRNTAFTYRDKPVDKRQIGRELDVRYVLEGSVQRLAASSASAPAERCRECGQPLGGAVRQRHGRFVRRAKRNHETHSGRPHLELIRAEAARPTKHPDALDYILRGRAILMKRPPRTIGQKPSLCSIAHLLSIRSPSRPRAG
jgi:adenylate cyclase